MNILDWSNFSRSTPRLHLALGGGGARAMAHIGVLKVLEKYRLPIERLSGTSGGAIIAALYAQQGTTKAVQARMERFLRSDAFRELGLSLFANEQKKDGSAFNGVGNLFHYLKSRLVFSRVLIAESLFSTDKLLELVSEIIDEGRIEDLSIPLQVIAVNVDTGEEVVLEKGDIIKAVAASSAIPGMFSPVELDGMRLIDGAIIHKVPLTDVAKTREAVIAVDVSRDIRQDYPKRMALDYIFRADEITAHRLNELHLQKADVVIRPQEARQNHWADFRHLDCYIESGEKAALLSLSEIRASLNRRDLPVRRWLWRKLCGGDRQEGMLCNSSIRVSEESSHTQAVVAGGH
ncbi:MAG: patatin-like phospholipase family protein [bacterium]